MKTKRIVAVILILLICLSLCACGGSEGGSAKEEIDLDNYPYVGTWVNDDNTVYIRIQEGGALKAESIATSTSTSTINGVTTTKNQ